MLRFDTPAQAAHWLQSKVTGNLQTDSRRVCSGDGFMAWPGVHHDGRKYLASALAQGATACLVEEQDLAANGVDGERVASYPALKQASGCVASAYYEEPSRQLAVLAVTGTNGKTSTAWWLAQALSGLQQVPPLPCGLIGTLGVGQPSLGDAEGQLVPFGLTTPDAVQLQQNLRHFVDTGLKACAMEASSIGIEQHRLAGTHIHTAVFTNFSQDHLDYHGTMQAYWQAKAQLFAWPGLKAAVVNVDDSKGAELVATASSAVGRPALWTYSVAGSARVQARAITYDGDGLQFSVVEGEQSCLLRTRLIGQFNVSNLLAVIAAMRSLGLPLTSAVQACARLSPVPGRMECYGQPGQVLAVVDFAHTPDALAQALLALRSLAQQRGGQLWCVFGCGGDRDASKRPLMGAKAATYADKIVLTSDNPRSEKAQDIIDQILLGLAGKSEVSVQTDRALAISQALSAAAPADVVLIAGKGHETTQEIAGQKFPCSDALQVQQFFSQQTSSADRGLVA